MDIVACFLFFLNLYGRPKGWYKNMQPIVRTYYRSIDFS